jgi:uncharacterized DUF497 family protein
MVYLRHHFEWDPAKSRRNLEKHGIAFEKAIELFGNPFVVVPARERNEHRFLVIGRIGHLYWSAIVTFRNLRLRLISVRRSRHEEKELHRSHHP